MRTSLDECLGILSDCVDDFSVKPQPLWHPLGFVSCIIHKSENGDAVRVHYWPEGDRRTKNPDWPIHTHSYNLRSLILYGSLKDIKYKVSDGHDSTVYEVRYSGDNSEILRTDRSLKIDGKVVSERNAGDTYDVLRGVFHQSQVAINSIAVTLVVISEIANDVPLVLGEGGDSFYPYDRLPYDKDIFWSAIKMALQSYKQKFLNKD